MSTAPPRDALTFRRLGPGRYRAQGVRRVYAIDAALADGGWRLSIDGAAFVVAPRKGELVLLARRLELGTHERPGQPQPDPGVARKP